MSYNNPEAGRPGGAQTGHGKRLHVSDAALQSLVWMAYSQLDAPPVGDDSVADSSQSASNPSSPTYSGDAQVPGAAVNHGVAGDATTNPSQGTSEFQFIRGRVQPPPSEGGPHRFDWAGVSFAVQLQCTCNAAVSAPRVLSELEPHGATSSGSLRRGHETSEWAGWRLDGSGDRTTITDGTHAAVVAHREAAELLASRTPRPSPTGSKTPRPTRTVSKTPHSTQSPSKSPAAGGNGHSPTVSRTPHKSPSPAPIAPPPPPNGSGSRVQLQLCLSSSVAHSGQAFQVSLWDTDAKTLVSTTMLQAGFSSASAPRWFSAVVPLRSGGVANGTYTVTVEKRTGPEGLFGTTSLYRALVSVVDANTRCSCSQVMFDSAAQPGIALVGPGAGSAPARRMEFIGDSLTVGYGKPTGTSSSSCQCIPTPPRLAVS